MTLLTPDLNHTVNIVERFIVTRWIAISILRPGIGPTKPLRVLFGLERGQLDAYDGRVQA